MIRRRLKKGFLNLMGMLLIILILSLFYAMFVGLLALLAYAVSLNNPFILFLAIAFVMTVVCFLLGFLIWLI